MAVQDYARLWRLLSPHMTTMTPIVRTYISLLFQEASRGGRSKRKAQKKMESLDLAVDPTFYFAPYHGNASLSFPFFFFLFSFLLVS